MKKNDIAFIIFVLLFAAASFFSLKLLQTKGDTVIITADGKIFCEKPLSENCEININDTNTAVIENGSVYMKYADCPDKLCMHMGKISDNSKKIICLPNKIIIEVTKKSDADTVVR